MVIVTTAVTVGGIIADVVIAFLAMRANRAKSETGDGEGMPPYSFNPLG